MADEPTPERTLVLSMQPAGPGEGWWAATAVLMSMVLFLAVVPFATVKLPRLSPFIPCYEATLIINDLITAALLFGQFSIARSRGLLVLASSFLFIALMTVCHALTFPGLFSEAGLLGAGIQSTAWIYMFWHAGFPIAVVCYSVLKDHGAARTPHPGVVRHPVEHRRSRRAGRRADGARHHRRAPAAPDHARQPLHAGDDFRGGNSLVAEPGRVVDLVRPATAFDPRPMAHGRPLRMAVRHRVERGVNAGRYDLGFYVGRLYGLSAASFVLAALILGRSHCMGGLPARSTPNDKSASTGCAKCVRN